MTVKAETTCCGRYGVAQTLLHSITILVNFYLGNAWIEVTAEELVAVVLYAFCQCPSAVGFQYQVTLACCGIIHGVETVALVAPKLTEATALLYAVVFVLGNGRTTPIRTLPWVLHVQLANLALVVRYVEVEVQTEVLLVYDYCIERQLYTLVRGLTEVLELVSVTGVGRDNALHQEVLGGIPVEV